MYQSRRSKKAVAPVLATLLMIAVAVAMSVIIFMWSQGFLSQTSGATGSQQGAQNQAAQSSIAIEAATGSASGTPGVQGSGHLPHGNVTLFVRNVGAVAVNLASIQLTGSSSNIGFNKSISVSLAIIGGKVTATSIPSSISSCELIAAPDCLNLATHPITGASTTATDNANCPTTALRTRCLIVLSASSSLSVAKGSSMTFTFTLPALPSGLTTTGKGFVLKSGDTINIKVTTDVGTFAQTSLTIP